MVTSAIICIIAVAVAMLVTLIMITFLDMHWVVKYICHALILAGLCTAIIAFAILTIQWIVSKEGGPQEFPQPAYRLDYKVITSGSQADTTYIITKIK